eukprot:403345000
MNSNSLFQQIQVLDQNISSFNFVIQSFQDNDQQIIIEEVLEKLNSILVHEKQLLYEIERQVSSKVDRIEFSSIVQQKANQADVQKILFEILNCNNLSASQKIQNFLENSIPHDQESTEQNLAAQNSSYHEHEMHHKRNKSAAFVDNPYSFNQNTIDRATDSPNKFNQEQCYTDTSIPGKYVQNQRNNPQYVLRQAFSSLSETLTNNKENNVMSGQFINGGTATQGVVDLQKLSQKIDDIYQSLCSCIQNHCASKDDFNMLQNQVELKVNKEDLDVALLQKANKQSVANALQRKANKQELSVIEQKVNEINSFQGIEEKFEDIRAMIERQKESYVDLLSNEIQIIKDETEQSLKKSIGKELQKLNSEISTIEGSFQKYCTQIKDTVDIIDRKYENSFKDIHVRIDLVQDMLKSDINQMKKFNFDLYKNDKSQEIERQLKNQIDQLHDIISTNTKDQQKEFLIIREETRLVKDEIRTINEMTKARIEESDNINKYNIETLTQELVKLSKETYYELDQIDREIQKLKYQNSNDNKGSSAQSNEIESLKLDQRDLKFKLEKLNDEVAIKSNIKDVCALVDLKANTEDVEKGLDTLFKEIQISCATKQSLDNIIVDQKFINEQLCALNCIGKWVWHGGFTSGGGLSRSPYSSKKNSFKMSAFERVQASDGSGQNGYVDFVKWQREIINTCPDNFELSKYEDDSSAIVIHSNGIYEILFTFFVAAESHKPSVQLRVNNKPVLSTIDTSSQVIYHQDSLRHISMTTYLHLSANSKIQICLSNSQLFINNSTQQLTNMEYTFSPDSAKGFISLRKL